MAGIYSGKYAGDHALRAHERDYRKISRYSLHVAPGYRSWRNRPLHGMVGFHKISWTGRISAINNGKIMVRLDKGPFRGFNASHMFTDEGNMTACYDEFSFQGFSEFPEDAFAKVMESASIVYAIASRKDTREALAAIESKKQTQGFNAIDQSATAG